MEPNYIKLPELEACLEKVVTIEQSTFDGVERITGKIVLLQIPWQIQLIEGAYDDGVFQGTLGQFLTFAGASGGIIKVESEGKAAYHNSQVPVPYPQFEVFDEEGLRAMNDLRRKCFGEGFDYIMDPSLS
ncbi:MAG: hypothetical protein EPN86_00120 [Nanoarchaeota archaeon]|nr:MAG: hypothetical protein EPN86_00120 [Nanoarchaeota archaeon]